MTGSIRRLSVLSSEAGGGVSFALDPTAPPLAGQVAEGATTFFQYGRRDGARGPGGLNLSDAFAPPYAH